MSKTQTSKTNITLKEIDTLKEDQRVFRSIGRMFVISNKADIVKTLNDDLSKINQEQKRYEVSPTIILMIC